MNEVADDEEDAEELTSTQQATNTRTDGLVTFDASEAQSLVMTLEIGAASHESMTRHVNWRMLTSGSTQAQHDQFADSLPFPDYPCEPCSEFTFGRASESNWWRYREKRLNLAAQGERFKANVDDIGFAKPMISVARV